MSGVHHAMDGWQTFSDFYDNEAAHYSVVSEEYGDYCAEQCTNGPEATVHVPIQNIVAALEEIVLNELSPTEHDGTD